MCSLENHEDRLKGIDTDLYALKRDMLLIDDYESLRDKDKLEKDKVLSGVKLPKISVSIFDWKVLNWESFGGQFDAMYHPL